ncbi:MAG: [FeFe] hydrogenase H-cluster radical SAM maturase HydE [Kiritimatiellia bacterium]
MEPDPLSGNKHLARADLLPLLRATGPGLAALYARADALRRARCGDAVPVRAIVEFSNVCANDCLYCGIRASNPVPTRYRMTPGEILASARQIAAAGVAGTIVLQSGETPGVSDDEIAAIIRRIKAECSGLAVTLSVGNRPRDVFARWRAAGMDRYLLRFETSNAELFARLHPDCTLAQRLQCLRDLQALGVQTGGGFMIGLPGETVEILADNILLCREFDFDMIGIGPYIPNPDTPLGDRPNAYAGDPDMFFRAIAVLRLANPDAHVPATTAYDAVLPNGRDLALRRGANVFMPNATPGPLRKDYQLYPGKPCIDEDASDCSLCVQARLRALGRPLAPGPSHSLKKPPT